MLDIGYFLSISTLIIAIFLSLYLVYYLKMGLQSPLMIWSTVNIASIFGYIFAIDYKADESTFLLLLITHLAFNIGVFVPYIAIKKNTTYICYHYKTSTDRLKRIFYRVAALEIVLLLYVSYSIFDSSGGMLNYFSEMMHIRTKIANPDYAYETLIVRPVIPHVLSISLFYVVTSIGAIIFTIKNNTNSPKKLYFLLPLLCVIVLSINDISRGRALDFLVIYLVSWLLLSKDIQIKLLVKFFLLAVFSLGYVSALQGKANFEIISVLSHFLTYFGLPIVYLDQYLINPNISLNFVGNETFHAIYNILNKVGFDIEYVRLENRGVSFQGGYTAILVYPIIKTFIVDWGVYMAMILIMLFGLVTSSYYIKTSSKNIIYIAIYLFLSVAVFHAYGGYKFGDSYYLISFFILIFIKFIYGNKSNLTNIYLKKG